jgi:hypothetical protein
MRSLSRENKEFAYVLPLRTVCKDLMGRDLVNCRERHLLSSQKELPSNRRVSAGRPFRYDRTDDANEKGRSHIRHRFGQSVLAYPSGASLRATSEFFVHRQDFVPCELP